MSNKAGLNWHIHVENTDVCATCYSNDNPVVTVSGFQSRTEAYMFVATYLTLLTTGKDDKASGLLQEFMSRVSH